jgi:hypothetical protein
MVDYYEALVTRHPAIVSIEDELDEKDYPHWIKLNERIGGRIQLVGDDFYITFPSGAEDALRSSQEGLCECLFGRSYPPSQKVIIDGAGLSTFPVPISR